jgi:hypothetical protein
MQGSDNRHQRLRHSRDLGFYSRLCWGCCRQEAHTRWRLEACPSNHINYLSSFGGNLSDITQRAQRPIQTQMATRSAPSSPTTKAVRLSFQSLPVPSNIPQTTSISILPCRTSALNDELGLTLRVIQSFLRTGRQQEAVHVAHLGPSGSSR